MYITQISLDNYRIYHGKNTLDLPKHFSKNVFVVSGNNGYGKTTLLTSLIWGLYGKLMLDVDDKFRREIYEAGGYKKYASQNFNRLAKSEYEALKNQFSEDKLNNLKEHNFSKYQDITAELSTKASYVVSILITDISIPGISCNNIEIIRKHDISKNEETIRILIDGKENELTKEVGDEIFISDFILPKEIAKFFFFDAEKIVALAEIKSYEEKKGLSKAYSEILGIKKYEDLKANLEDLRIRLRRSSASDKEKNKLFDLQKESEQLKKLIVHNQEQLEYWNGEKQINKQLSEQLQEKLIREGNSLTATELSDLKKVREKLTLEANNLKAKLKELLDIAPFAIAGNLFMKAHLQSENELEAKSKSLNPDILNRKAKKIKDSFSKELGKRGFKKQQVTDAGKALDTMLTKYLVPNNGDDSYKVLLGFEDKEVNEFDAIYNNLKFSFSIHFKQIVKEYKNNRIFFNKVIRKISLAESKESDFLIKEIRLNKVEIDDKLINIDKRIMEINQEIGAYQKELSIKLKVVSELEKKVGLEEKDKAKDEAAKRMIDELTTFISTFKKEKKKSLEERIKNELNSLMHKKGFINKVQVVIEDEVIDINLFDKRDHIIDKESLSKGEQQLYATSLLKALVDESNIKFPVFIDSPLQKFDKNHSINIIRDFYPNISEQVVLFPLLEKELSEYEFNSLLPKINKVYLITNKNEDNSGFVEIEATKLFKSFKKDSHHVYSH